jgi:hypothetical protein
VLDQCEGENEQLDDEKKYSVASSANVIDDIEFNEVKIENHFVTHNV